MNNIEIRHLRAFIAVAEELNYRKAARRLHVAQPALSRTIQQLENELGARVLERSTSAVQLTAIGRFLLDRARDMLGALQGTFESVHRMTLGHKGELFVGFNDFTISEFLPPIIHRFRSAFPDVAINLIDETSPNMLRMVLENRLDIAFLSGIAPPPDLDSLLLREEKFVALLPVGHALAQRRQIKPEDLRDEQFVMGEPAWSVYLNAVDEYCRSAGFKPRVVQTAVHSNGIVNFVAAGLGVSIYVDRDWLRERKDIVVRPMPKPKVQFKTLAMWRRTARTAALDNLIATMHEVLAR